jgi:GT2 family glycosyltransferase
VTVEDLEPGAVIADAGDVIVCVPLYGAHNDFVSCLRSLLAHTPAATPILIADDATPDERSRAFIDELAAAGISEHRLIVLRQPENLGFPGNVNAAFAAAGRADVVLVNSDCQVAERWLDGMRDAALSDARIATASALTNHGTLLSVPRRNRPMSDLPQDVSLDAAAAAIRAGSPRLRPRIPTAVGHCVYVRRAALDLVGPFDQSFAPGYGEEVDFSQRCLVHGLCHVVADDVFVLHRGGASLAPEGRELQDRHERMLKVRYPYYHAMGEEAQERRAGPLPQSLSAARSAMLGLEVTIDARCLGRFITGTQVATLELLHALWRTRRVRLRAVIPEEVGDYATETLASMPGVELLPPDAISEELERSDIVHRPYAVGSTDDLDLLRMVGERTVVTQLDLIAYHNPAYFQSFAGWERHRTLTRLTLSVADRVLFISDYAATDARAEELIDPHRLEVVPMGVDHHLGSLRPEPAAPPGAEGLEPGSFLLCLGTDYLHKNRLFSLRLLEELRRRHGFTGVLVLAGPHVPVGSSRSEEAEYLATRPDLARAVRVLPAVDEAEKRWLYTHAAAVLYPSTSEGFGFIPFEAAERGTPCFFASVTSMADVLPGVTAVIEPWDAVASAVNAAEVLGDPAASARIVAEISAAASRLLWDETAERTLAAYATAAASPTRDVGGLLEALEGGGLAAGHQHALRAAIGDTGMALVGNEEKLLPEKSQRALAALASRRLTRRPLLASLEALHNLARAVQGRGERGTKRPPP